MTGSTNTGATFRPQYNSKDLKLNETWKNDSRCNGFKNSPESISRWQWKTGTRDALFNEQLQWLKIKHRQTIHRNNTRHYRQYAWQSYHYRPQSTMLLYPSTSSRTYFITIIPQGNSRLYQLYSCASIITISSTSSILTPKTYCT